MNFNPCAYCGMIHQGVCPKIKRIEYHQDGSVKSVEFYQPIAAGDVILTKPVIEAFAGLPEHLQPTANK